jgi:hypothetical protein
MAASTLHVADPPRSPPIGMVAAPPLVLMGHASPSLASSFYLGLVFASPGLVPHLPHTDQGVTVLGCSALPPPGPELEAMWPSSTGCFSALRRRPLQPATPASHDGAGGRREQAGRPRATTRRHGGHRGSSEEAIEAAVQRATEAAT